MKITIVVGGRWHAFDLAKELYKKGHLERLITNYPKWYVMKWGLPNSKIISLPFTFWVVKAIYKIGGEALMMKCQWLVHSWFAKRAVKYLAGSQLVHGWSGWSEPSLKWAKKQRIPTVVERSSAHIIEQSRLLDQEYKRLGLKWVRTHKQIECMEKREYELADTIAVPSLFVETSFKHRGFTDDKLFRNSFGVNLKSFKAPVNPPDPPSIVGLKVIYAGSLSVRKGIHDLLEGFKGADLPNSKLVLIGGQTPELMPVLASKPRNVEMLGHIKQNKLIDHYREGHCFVMASIEEGMAMVQLQALAAGLPLICTTNTGGEDLLMMNGGLGKQIEMGIKEFPAGFVIKIHSPESISYCLRKIANNQELWLQMRNEAIKLASRELSWSNYAERAISNYKSLLGGKA